MKQRKRKLQDPDKTSTEKKFKKKKIATENLLDSDEETVFKSSDSQFTPNWHDYEILAENLSLRSDVAINLISLFENGNEIPFIARYRKSHTQNMSPEQLRDAKNCFQNIMILKKRMQNILQALDKTKILDKAFLQKITTCRNMEELEHLVGCCFTFLKNM